MNKILKKAGLIFSALILLLYFSNLIGGAIIYNIMFDRFESPDYSITPGIVVYSEVSNLYKRDEVSFKSKNNRLAGYYYEIDDSEAIVVMSHGIHDGADSLLNQAIFFIDNGYSVFSYDNSGCANSTGKSMGFTQSLIDLEAALNYVSNNYDKKILLFGFSWGGFASAAILNFDYNIYGSVSISGYNDSTDLIISKGKSYVGPLVYSGEWVVRAIDESRFQEYNDYKGITGINNSNVPVFIAHGENDSVIRYNKESILRLSAKFTNPNVTTYYGINKGHTDILYSAEAINYQSEVLNKLSQIDGYKEKVDYVNTVDDKLYSELNSELFTAILDFYNECIY